MVLATTGTILFGGLALIAGGIFGEKVGEKIADIAENIGERIKTNNPTTTEIAKNVNNITSETQDTEKNKLTPQQRYYYKKYGTIEEQNQEAVMENTPKEQTQEAVMENTPTPNETPPLINETVNTNPTIMDKTDENTETSINGIGSNLQYALQWAEEQQQKQWEREDAIRKETQEREDTAYSRAIQDLRKAGVNPNLFSVSPAESGGGITQATGLDMTLYQEEVKKYISEFETLFNSDIKVNENTKDRVLEVVGKLITMAGMIGLMKK